MLGHMSDGERVFAYRALSIGRGDPAPLPGFEQDDWMATAGFGRRAIGDLVAEWRAVRAATIVLAESLTADRRSGGASPPGRPSACGRSSTSRRATRRTTSRSCASAIAARPDGRSRGRSPARRGRSAAARPRRARRSAGVVATRFSLPQRLMTRIADSTVVPVSSAISRRESASGIVTRPLSARPNRPASVRRRRATRRSTGAESVGEAPRHVHLPDHESLQEAARHLGVRVDRGEEGALRDAQDRRGLERDRRGGETLALEDRDGADGLARGRTGRG